MCVSNTNHLKTPQKPPVDTLIKMVTATLAIRVGTFQSLAFSKQVLAFLQLKI
jgi:hypothetical protein